MDGGLYTEKPPGGVVEEVRTVFEQLNDTSIHIPTFIQNDMMLK